MRIKIDEDACIACGACAAIAPDVFEVEDIAKVIMDPVSEELEDDVKDAIEGCPTGAIIENEEEEK